jgi:BirA family transcriptional regulator, biotin operon repressor / biotin---[acetyl-CoA-carboxylase] ligase
MNDALDADAILAALPADVAAGVASLRVLAQTASTQADALADAAPTHGCAIVLAERQTAGEGRRGRRWISPPGANIACSLSRRFARDAASMSGLSLAVGVALAEALHGLGYPQVRLKWPNDLLVEGRKLGGILVNLRAEPEACTAVIGVGLNVRIPAADGAAIDQPWCDLAALAEPPARNALVAALLESLLPALDAFDAEGLSPLLARWQPLDALVGQTVQLTEGDTRHVGLCQGIAPDGALRLRDAAGGVHDYYGGEASVRPA